MNLTNATLLTDIIAVLSRTGHAQRANTIIVFPGQGETERVLSGITHANFLLARHITSVHIMIAGDNPDDPRAHIFERTDDLRSVWPDLRHSAHIRYTLQGVARNTKQQADWTCAVLRNEDARPAHLMTSAYHMPRAFMTLVASIMRTMEERDWPPIIPYPTSSEMSTANLVAREMECLMNEQRAGDVATHEQLMDYLKVVRLRT